MQSKEKNSSSYFSRLLLFAGAVALVALSALFLSSLPTSASHNANHLPSPQKQTAKHPPTQQPTSRPLIITSSDSMPPLSWTGNDGAPHGFVIDFWREWSKVTGVPISFKLTSWHQTIPLVVSGQADIHGGLYFSVERRDRLSFGSHLYNMKGAIMVRNDVQAKTPEELSHVAVGVLRNGYSEYHMRTRYPQLSLVPFNTMGQLANAAATGQIVALTSDWITINEQFKQKGISDQFKILKIAYNRPLHAGVRKGNEELLLQINNGMNNISPETRSHIFQRWVLKSNLSTLFSGVNVVIIGLFILLLASLICSHYKAKQIQHAHTQLRKLQQQVGELEQQTNENTLTISHYKSLHRHLPNIDQQTALPNAKQFASTLETLWQTSLYAKQPVSLFILEIRGVSLSPNCLFNVSQLLMNNTATPTDMPAYLGAQTFACLMPNTEQNEAKTVISCLELSLADLPCLDALKHPTLQAFIGVATSTPSPSKKSTSLISRAKDNMQLKTFFTKKN